MAASFSTGQVRRYYDRHTPTFLALGPRRSRGAIHRAVHAPGLTGSRVFRYVEDRVASLIEGLGAESGPIRIVDLGCGVGESLSYLAERLPVHGIGVTLSPVQASLAAARIAKRGVSDRVACLVGDFSAVPCGDATADVAYAIESFVHAADPAVFFAQCRAVVRPGGWLVICDDFARPVHDPKAERTRARFRQGWHVNTLVTPDELRALAEAAGFEHQSTTDLTPYLDLGRPRDRLVDALLRVFGWMSIRAPRYDYLIGGSALQTCLRRGWIGYDLALFTRRKDDADG